MELFFAQVVNGILIGSQYALLVTGINLIILVAGVFQYAYPHLIVMSMYVYWYALKFTNNNIFLGMIATIASAIIMSILSEPLFRSAIKRGAELSTFFISLGIAMIITDVQSQRLHAGIPIGFPPEVLGGDVLFSAGLIFISTGQLLTFFGSIAAVLAFLFLLYRTKHGRAFRAISQSQFSARLLGIPIIKSTMFSYLITGVLGGITAIFLAMSLGSAAPGLGDILALKILCVALFAGMGNLQGGLIAAIIVGILESLAMGYVPGRWADSVVFGAIIIAIIIRPKGLFGVRT